MSYSREVFSEAAAVMEKRRLLSEQELEERRHRLYLVCPRAQEIERSLVRTSVAAAKAVVAGADIKDELAKLKDRSLQLQTELQEILEKRKLPRNYLEQQFECEKCSDTGYIDGKMCSCMKQLLRQTAYQFVNGESKLALTDFDSFVLEYYPDTALPVSGKSVREYMRSVLRFCRRYAENFSEESSSLLFQGGPGLGKTHLSLAIAKEVIDRGCGVIYVSAPNMLKRLEDEHFGRSSNERGVSAELMSECDLLIIDDLGTEFITKFSIPAIYNILNTRILSELPTIISTNLSMKGLQEIYGDRMISRIIGMLDRVEFKGNDIRQLKRRERNIKNS
ncbi:MAG: ATP-binding protein [Clostridia bacterium]|nr:ATP-binding protein [Clostridia bacterium]